MPSETPLTYESYLRVPEILGAQVPLSSPEAHDELQFIIVHQVYELWFKLLLHEVRGAIAHLQAGESGQAHWLLGRCVEIARVLIQQIHVMETMSPASFLEFRDVLKPASGLQSVQFRVLEYHCGPKDPRYIALHASHPESRKALEAAYAAPSLWDGFCEALQHRGFAAGSREEQLKALVRIYTEREFLDLHRLAETMLEFDEAFRIWRFRHYLMAERMIGFKPGTGVAHTEQVGFGSHGKGETHPGEHATDSGRCPVGGAGLPPAEDGQSFHDPGVHYLKSRVEIRYFPLLWELRSHLGSDGYGI
ncbi:MAG: tryptophan 2,3-dioxygenase [Holophagaceae bacterium]|nr:tryptophan 2,3-dioxygenase [Holophagaceae bacterium]